MVSTGIIYSVFPLYLADLGMSTIQIGTVFSVGAVGGALGGVLMGRATDRIGRKNVLLATMVMFSTVFSIYAYATQFLQMYVAQVLEGAAWAGESTAATALIGDLTSRRTRGAGLGVYNTSSYLGWIVGPSLGGALAESLGFRLTFLLCALLNAMGLILTALFLKREIR